MNQAAHTMNTTPVTRFSIEPKASSGESWLQQLVKKIIRAAKAESTTPQCEGYLEANLLDPSVGPEISRTLRR